MDGQQQWEHDGYLILRAAVPAAAIGGVPDELQRLRDGLLVRTPGDEHASLAAHAAPGSAGAVDPYAISDASRAVLLPEPVVATLTELFGGDAPLLFDATEALAGAPDPGPYRDATYVAVSGEPDTLTVAVVALGEGNLRVTLHPGSQRIATTPFSGRYRHFNPERDGDAALARHRAEVAAAIQDLPPTTLSLAPGDVLLFAGGLIHEPIAGDALIAHLCPLRAQPSWFAYRPERARLAAVGDAWITTQHYDLVDAIEREPEPKTPEDDAETEREIDSVEDALRAHDDRPPDAPAAPPPGPMANRRTGGLVNSVRGLMGRRGRR
jgi:hypothetical protein